MHTLLHLIIAHLLADFVFQSNDLVREKQKKISGHLKHAGILAFFIALAVLPFWYDSRAWAVVALISITHFFQDQIKIKVERDYSAKPNLKLTPWPFIVDQIVHLMIIALAFSWLKHVTPTLLDPPLFDLYRNEKLAFFLFFLILVGFAFDVVTYQFQKTRKKNLNFRRDYKALTERLLFFLLVYGLALLIGFLRGQL